MNETLGILEYHLHRTKPSRCPVIRQEGSCTLLVQSLRPVYRPGEEPRTRTKAGGWSRTQGLCHPRHHSRSFMKTLQISSVNSIE